MLRRLFAILTGASLSAGCSSSLSEPNPLGQPGTFAIKELSSAQTAEGTKKVWLATVSEASGKTFHFGIEMLIKQGKGPIPIAFSKAAFVREAGNDGRDALGQIAKTIDATTVPTHSEKLQRLDFSIVILGMGMSRHPEPDGHGAGYAQNPPGSWMTSKAFLKGGEAEVFLNINPDLGVGEFSPKDPDYGNDVVAELAKIFLP
jgi:hypothetical protein